MVKPNIRRGKLEDVFSVATIHKQQFPTHFLGKYSVNLLAQYYKPLLPYIFLVSDQKGSVNGFVVGGTSNQLVTAKREFLVSNKHLYITETLLRPRTYLGALARVKSLVTLRNVNENQSTENDFVWLLSIAVDKSALGTGVSQDLCAAFEQSLGTSSSYGLYVLKDNIRAITFYEKMGFEISKEVGNELCLIKNLRE